MARRIALVALVSLLFVPSAWGQKPNEISLLCYEQAAVLNLVGQLRIVDHASRADVINTLGSRHRRLIDYSFTTLPRLTSLEEPVEEHMALSARFYAFCRGYHDPR